MAVLAFTGECGFVTTTPLFEPVFTNTEHCCVTLPDSRCADNTCLQHSPLVAWHYLHSVLHIYARHCRACGRHWTTTACSGSILLRAGCTVAAALRTAHCGGIST